jgi:hypothetical protein
MNNSEQYTSMVSSCEAAARHNRHVLGIWYPVAEQLHASLCEVCDAMALITRPGYEKHWRIGGSALEQECLGYE